MLFYTMNRAGCKHWVQGVEYGTTGSCVLVNVFNNWFSETVLYISYKFQLLIINNLVYFKLIINFTDIKDI